MPARGACDVCSLFKMWCWGSSGGDLPPGFDTVIYSGTRGPEGNCPPFEVEVDLTAVSDINVCSSQSGPEGGVDALRSCAPDLTLLWDEGTANAFGHSISLYDCNPQTGARNGEPIADCFGVVAYGNHDAAILAVADGVSWGEPARRAARCAILGVLQYLHAALCHLGAQQRQTKETPAACMQGKSRAGVLTSNLLFKEMVQAVHAGQALILQQMGTLTTLVLSLVVPHSAQCDKYKRLAGNAKALKSSKSASAPRSWAVLSLTVGDSSAWVWRSITQQVEELTHAAHEGELRNARFTPGALGYATGEEPDLSNMTLSCTLIKPGDIVFLGSDGIGDNYDPCMLKLARPAPYAFEMTSQKEVDPSEPPALTPNQMQQQSLQLLGRAVSQVAAASTAQAAAARLAEVAGDTGAPRGWPQQVQQQMQSAQKSPATPRSPQTPSSQQELDDPPLNAQQLVLGVLELTFKSTEPLRVATMERARQAEQERNAGRAAAAAGISAGDSSLCTDAPRVKAGGRVIMPPGKLDHATLCAFQAPNA